MILVLFIETFPHTHTQKEPYFKIKPDIYGSVFNKRKEKRLFWGAWPNQMVTNRLNRLLCCFLALSSRNECHRHLWITLAKKISNTLIIASAASCKGGFNVARSKVGHISILQISFVLEAPEPANVREIDQNEIFKNDIKCLFTRQGPRQGVYTSHFGVRTFFSMWDYGTTHAISEICTFGLGR